MKKLIINGKTPVFPIIQGGMGIGISFNKLVSSVLNEGIIGTLSIAQAGFKKDNHKTENIKANLEAITEEIQKVRNINPTGILGVNVMCATHEYETQIKHLANQDIDFVISGAGLPIDLPIYLKNSKVKPAMIVSNDRSANLLLRKWDKKHGIMPEFIVVEGPLAGGHLGFTKAELASDEVKTLQELCVGVLEVVEKFEIKYNKSIPVIAAGGIFTSKDINEFLEIGCAGVQMATRFIATDECDADLKYKQKLVDANEEDIVEVASPVGYPGRAVRNKFTEFIKKENIPVSRCVRCLKTSICNSKDIPYCITEKLGGAVLGDVENGLIFTGANGYKITKIVSVHELVKELTQDL